MLINYLAKYSLVLPVKLKL